MNMGLGSKNLRAFHHVGGFQSIWGLGLRQCSMSFETSTPASSELANPMADQSRSLLPLATALANRSDKMLATGMATLTEAAVRFTNSTSFRPNSNAK